jgi:alpha-tubulin suppressor-like RCC1 family protein
MFPKGVIIVKLITYEIGIALDAAGKVWTWGGGGIYGMEYLLARGIQNVDYKRPGVIPLPGAAREIAGGRKWNYALLKDNSLYGWGTYTSYLGLSDKGFANQPAPQLRPQRLDGILRLPKPVRSIYTNSVTSYAILQDSTLWAWGDNAMGTVGNGEELDFSHYKRGDQPAPYAWDWGPGQLMVLKPVPLARGLHSYTGVWVANSLVYYAYAVDVNGQLYSWGRNKGAMLGNGVVATDMERGQLTGEYPNSWDVPFVTPVNPFGLKRLYRATSPHCITHPEGNICNLYRTPQGFAPKAVAEAKSVKGEMYLDGTGSHESVQDEDKGIIRYVWKQVSGPSKAIIVLPSVARAKVFAAVAGDYTFRLVVTDNGWKSDSTTVTVKL